eukprot:g4186.t1
MKTFLNVRNIFRMSSNNVEIKRFRYQRFSSRGLSKSSSTASFSSSSKFTKSDRRTTRTSDNSKNGRYQRKQSSSQLKSVQRGVEKTKSEFQKSSLRGSLLGNHFQSNLPKVDHFSQRYKAQGGSLRRKRGGDGSLVLESTADYNNAISSVLYKSGASRSARQNRYKSSFGSSSVGDTNYDEALGLFTRMRQAGVPPNVHTYNLMLKACEEAQIPDPDNIFRVNREKLKPEKWFAALSQIGGLKPDKKTYEQMIRCCQATGDITRAFYYFEEARLQGFVVDQQTHVTLIKTCASKPDLDAATRHIEWLREEAARRLALDEDADVSDLRVVDIMFDPLLTAAIRDNQADKAVYFLEQMLSCPMTISLSNASRSSVETLGSCIIHNELEGAKRSFQINKTILELSKKEAVNRSLRWLSDHNDYMEKEKENIEKEEKEENKIESEEEKKQSKITLLDRGTCLALVNLASRRGDLSFLEDIFNTMEENKYEIEQVHYDAYLECVAKSKDMRKLCEAIVYVDKQKYEVSPHITSLAANELLRSPLATQVIDETFFYLQDLRAGVDVRNRKDNGNAEILENENVNGDEEVSSVEESVYSGIVPVAAANVIVLACSRRGDATLALSSVEDWETICTNEPDNSTFCCLLECAKYIEGKKPSQNFVNDAMQKIENARIDWKKDAILSSAVVSAHLLCDELEIAVKILEDMKGKDWSMVPTRSCMDILIGRVTNDKALINSKSDVAFRLLKVANSLVHGRHAYISNMKEEKVKAAYEYLKNN